jgi:hypothetical protein
LNYFAARADQTPEDAVYAHFDGLGLDLKLNSHENECVVYLEPEVMQNLIEFWKAIVEEK